MATLQASSIQGELTLSAGSTKAYGGSEWTTKGATNGIHIPYGGSYYAMVIWRNLGYTRDSCRIYYSLSISQQHGGLIDFQLSRYGGGITHTSFNTGYAGWQHQQYASNANYYQCRVVNGNGASWGNGTFDMTIWYWGRDAPPATGAAGTDDNFSSTQSGNYLRRSI